MQLKTVVLDSLQKAIVAAAEDEMRVLDIVLQANKGCTGNVTHGAAQLTTTLGCGQQRAAVPDAGTSSRSG